MIYLAKSKKGMGGENARRDGACFEEALVKELNRGGILRQNIINKLKESFPSAEAQNLEFNFICLGKQKFEDVFRSKRKVAAKSDILVEIINNEKKTYLGISVKKTDERTQIHITRVDRFLKVIENRINSRVPEIVIKAFKKFCGVSGYTPQELNLTLEEQSKLKQLPRQRFLLNELTKEEQFLLLDWVKKHLIYILELVLARGSIADSKFFATHYLYYQGHYQSHDQIEASLVQIDSIENMINKIKPENVNFSKKFGCLNLGLGIQFQMRGSGKTRNQKTSLQFQKNSRLSDNNDNEI